MPTGCTPRPLPPRCAPHSSCIISLSLQERQICKFSTWLSGYFFRKQVIVWISLSPDTSSFKELSTLGRLGLSGSNVMVFACVEV